MAHIFTQVLQFSRRYQRFYVRQFQSLLAEHALTMREMDVLLFLSNNPGYDTARDVTELRGLPKSQVSQAVERLAERRLLLRTADSADRRVIHLTMTEDGQTLARQGQAIQAACFHQVLRDLTPAERGALERLAEKILTSDAFHQPLEGESST